MRNQNQKIRTKSKPTYNELKEHEMREFRNLASQLSFFVSSFVDLAVLITYAVTVYNRTPIEGLTCAFLTAVSGTAFKS